jgi:hypothetical protein
VVDKTRASTEIIKIFFCEGPKRKSLVPFCVSRENLKEECEVPNFTESKTDRAYESFMKQVPGFQRDPPEAEIIRKDMERNKKKKGGREDGFPQR